MVVFKCGSQIVLKAVASVVTTVFVFQWSYCVMAIMIVMINLMK